MTICTGVIRDMDIEMAVGDYKSMRCMRFYHLALKVKSEVSNFTNTHLTISNLIAMDEINFYVIDFYWFCVHSDICLEMHFLHASFRSLYAYLFLSPHSRSLSPFLSLSISRSFPSLPFSFVLFLSLSLSPAVVLLFPSISFPFSFHLSLSRFQRPHLLSLSFFLLSNS